MFTFTLIKRCALLAIALLLALPISAISQVSFSVSFNEAAGPLTATERTNITAHVQEAGQTWIRVLNISGARSISVLVSTDTMIATANGRSETSGFVFALSGRDTFEQGMAAELRTGSDPNGATADVLFSVGLNYLRNELWFDPNPSTRSAVVPNDKTDAMSVFIHEFGHAIAYNGWANLADGTPPSTFWSVFDRWMVPGVPTPFTGTQSVAAWGSNPILTTNNIFHWGNSSRLPLPELTHTQSTVIWENGRPKPPIICQAMHSIDRAEFAQVEQIHGSLINQLMNGVVFLRGSRYYISSLDLGVLQDVGLSTNSLLFANGFE